jgi:geranylgeranyl diphosphate synthase type II
MVDTVLEAALHDAVSGGAQRAEAQPPRLREALHHAVFPGGARVRPRLCLEVAKALGASGELAVAAACSVELLHCASLVHDDLPCFDDAPTRRGRPTVHRAYGEAMAVLVGDALIVAAFETLTRALASRPDAGMAPMLVLLRAAGSREGLVAGQAWELEDDVDLAAYHRGKTASLFEASAMLGALVAGCSPAAAQSFAAFGRAFGMAYQVADDVADVVADAASHGKPTGRDRALARPSAMQGVESPEAAFAELDRAAAGAADAIPIGDADGELRSFVEAVFEALSARLRPRRDGTTTLAAQDSEGYPGRSNGQIPDPRRRLSRLREDLPG